MKTDLFDSVTECGCAAKIPADRLKSILSDLKIPANENVVVGPDTLDDAGIYRLSDEEYLVQTVDYFPPVARDAYTYGQISAANSLSDVYAMGGRPLTALAIVCFPAESLGPDVLKEITRGAVDKLSETGAVLLGGHSIVDPQPKYGLAVTGVVKPDDMMDNAHAEPGDILILTKPIGTGVTVMAAKGGIASRQQEDEANRCMAELNAMASSIAVAHGVRSCTDITGFGLLGHSMQMAGASGVSIELWAGSIPMLEGAEKFAGMGLLSSAAYSNREYVGDAVHFDDDIAMSTQDLLFDPQTSGGLLVACGEDRADDLLRDLKSDLGTRCEMIGAAKKAGSEGGVIDVTVDCPRPRREC